MEQTHAEEQRRARTSFGKMRAWTVRAWAVTARAVRARLAAWALSLLVTHAPVAAAHHAAAGLPSAGQPAVAHPSHQAAQPSTTALLPHAARYAAAPYAGLYNHAHQAMPFRWGWFGAQRFSPPTRWHRGYYGDHYHWRRR